MSDVKELLKGGYCEYPKSGKHEGRPIRPLSFIVSLCNSRTDDSRIKVHGNIQLLGLFKDGEIEVVIIPVSACSQLRLSAECRNT